MVEHILEHLPNGAHVVIGSRATVPLQLARLKAHGLLAEIGKEELRFNATEIAGFIALEKGGCRQGSRPLPRWRKKRRGGGRPAVALNG